MVMTMGFETLPHNDAAALMNHLATKGEESMMMILVVFKIFYCPRWCMTWLLKWWLWLIIDNDNNIKHWSGPLSASVAASDWSAYRGGVFDGCDYNGNMVYWLMRIIVSWSSMLKLMYLYWFFLANSDPGYGEPPLVMIVSMVMMKSSGLLSPGGQPRRHPCWLRNWPLRGRLLAGM